MEVSDLSASLLPTAQVTPASPSGSVLPIPGCRKGVSPFPQDLSIHGVLRYLCRWSDICFSSYWFYK